jgi:hypothetical protein
MEQLVTVADGNRVDMSAIDPQAPPPDPLVPPAGVAKPPAAVEKPKVEAVKAVEKPLDRKLRLQLSEPVDKITLTRMPLGEAVKPVASIGAINVSFDLDAMEELGVSLRDPVTLDAAGSVDSLLRQIAAARGMALTVNNGQVLFTCPPEFRQDLRSMRYTVSDLTHGDAREAAALAALIERFVAPESWRGAGGSGSIEASSPDVLQVTQSGHGHYQTIVFCEKLRIARGLPIKSRMDPKKLSLESRTYRAKAILGHVTSVNIGVATPLSEILEQFKQPTGTEILIDRPSLAAAGVSENIATKLRSENLPQGIVLRQLLEPLGLAWRAVDAGMLQVTSKDTASTRQDLEFYSLRDHLAGQQPQALIEKIKAAAAAAGGDAKNSGAVYYDPASQSVIVLQTQPVQQVIEALLARSGK